MTEPGASRGRSAGLLGHVRACLHRWGAGSQRAMTALLVALTLLASVGIVTVRPWVPPSTYLLIELLGAFLLRLRAMVVLCAAIVAQALLIALTGLGEFTPGTYLLQGIAIAALLMFAAYRERLGLQGAPGDLMIVDLRDRFAANAVVPRLPDGWRVQTALHPAHREAFSGDFVLTATRERGTVLELALVDVSGKGQDAGVRSLQLSGALSGLLSAQAAPALGVVPGAAFGSVRGRIEPGDVLILYTDGLVEVPGRDLDLGIDRLRGAVEDVLATRRGGADDVIARIGADEGDDRALVLVRKD